MRKNGLRVAPLCVVATLSAMAFAVAPAQAEVGSQWNVNGHPISKELVEKGVVPEPKLENNHGVLLSHAFGKELNILCTFMEFSEARLKLEGSSLGKARFTGCRITTNGGEVLSACEPHTGAEKGVILTVLLKDLIVLEAEGIAKEGYDRLEPEEGTKFVTITTSASCAFGENIPVITEIGKGFVSKDSNLELRAEKFTHLLEEGPGTKLWTMSKTE